MKKIILAFVLLFALSNCDSEPLHTIFDIKDVRCHGDGGGFFEADFTSTIVISQKIQFNLTLEGPEGPINVMCWAEGKGGGDSAFVSDVISTEIDLTDSDSTNLRGLQIEDDVYYAGCHFNDPDDAGEYQVKEVKDSGFKLEKEFKVQLQHCLSESEADARMNIRLSFRQVNSFDLTAFTFMFYGFTSEKILKDYYFIFKLWALKDGQKLQKIDAKCTLDGGEDIEVSDTAPIAPAAFKCSFADQVSGIDLDQVQIISSEGVAGLPFDFHYLNPYWIDLEIKARRLIDVSTITFIPSFPKIDKSDFNFTSDFSYFTWTIPFKETGLGIKVGDFFKFPLAFPTGTLMKVIILSLDGENMKLKFEIQGKIENKPLIWEQTVISFNGIEIFILPAFKTDPITTEGCPQDPVNTDQAELPGSDQPFSSDDSEFEEEPMTEEEALRRAELPLSFRQVNDFKPGDNEITFTFYALTTKDLTLDGNYSTITIFIQLIGPDGLESKALEANCTLAKDVTLGEEKLLQANYECKIEGINSTGNYTSLRVNKSDDIAGLPSNEVLLNPAMADQAIADNELKNCTEDSSVPPVFTVESIDNSSAQENGTFIIKGELDGQADLNKKITFPLTYPEGVSLVCSFNGEGFICMPDQEVNGSVIMEQTIMSEGAEELFILGSFVKKGMNCKNGVLMEAEKKVDIEISFRQVSHIEQISNGLSFFFAAWVKNNLAAGESIEMNVLLDEGGKKVEKNATCELNEAVTTSNEPVQGDFKCTVTFEEGEEIPPENLTVSTNNENIGGCEDLTEEEASPNATDSAIAESAELNNSLAITYDLSNEDNKNNTNITPPTFTINSINVDRCKKKGKIKLTGTFDQDITEEITFELSLSFPLTDIKCTVENATADTETEITCKIQKVKKFAKFNKFVFEPKMIKNKRKEMLFIKGKSLEGSDETMKYSFNDLKLEQIKKKKKAKVSFLQFGPPRSGFLFFMALMKLPGFTQYETTTFEASLIRESSTFRLLAEDEVDGALDCSVDDSSASTSVGILNCKDSSGNENAVSKVDLSDQNVGGTPDTAPVETNPSFDYSKNLDLSVPTVTITDIEKNSCSKNGQYIIKGTTDKDLEEGNKIYIPFSSPDSKGLCHVSSGSAGSTITMTCENTQQFNAPKEMLILPQMIKKEDDSTPYFQIAQPYTQKLPFSCIISDKSLKNDPGNLSSSSSSSGSRLFSGKSKGLSGGAIAGIVIACIAAVAIVGTIIALSYKGVFSKGVDATQASIDNNSTVNKLNMNNQNANIV